MCDASQLYISVAGQDRGRDEIQVEPHLNRTVLSISSILWLVVGVRAAIPSAVKSRCHLKYGFATAIPRSTLYLVHWHDTFADSPDCLLNEDMRHDSLPVAQLGAWASINDVELFGAEVKAHIIDDVGNDKGGGLVATKEHASSETLLKIPADIILSRNRVEGCAKVDGRLRELLEALPTLTEVGD